MIARNGNRLRYGSGTTGVSTVIIAVTVTVEFHVGKIKMLGILNV
jgi:hypothetical protein